LKDAGYIFAFQDVRGKGYSEGEYVNVRPELRPGEPGIDESTDAWDTIDYLVKHVPDNNGRVGLWGISYPGFYAAAAAIHGHPALKAVSPQAPVSDWFVGDDVHHNGAFFLQDNFTFSAFFDVPRLGPGRPGEPLAVDPRPNAYDFFLTTGALPNFDRVWYRGRVPYWRELMDHGTYDQYWKDRALTDHLDGITCPMLFVGGWFDAEDLWGTLHDYQAVTRLDRDATDLLVMGPWFHGMWADRPGRTFGNLDFGQDTSAYFQDDIEFPFFERYLRQHGPAPPQARVFLSGRNEWRTYAQWPPSGLARGQYFLTPGGGLSTSAPVAGGTASYSYDPAHPTPYLADYGTSRERTREYMTDDQRFDDGRPDVVSFRTAALASSLTLAGPIDVNLWMKTTGSDADFVVKVIDVWPEDSAQTGASGKSMAGYEQLLRGDIFRGKFREGFDRPRPFLPGEPTRVQFTLNDAFHTFLPGHRVMVQIQSAWFPLVDRNSNVFEDLYHADDADFREATITVLLDRTHPTSIEFGTLK
jgi:hypothetical protein